MKTKDVFSKIDELIPQLREQGFDTLANILDHRLHRVAWTSGSELRDELRTVLSEVDYLNSTLKKEVEQVIKKL